MRSFTIVILCIVLAVVCFALGYVSQELEITKNQCEVRYGKISD